MDYFDERDYLKEIELEGESEIEKFYSNQEVFITGGTGLIGQLLVEKFLRCIPSVKKIYLLIRQRKGKSEKERAREMFAGHIFEKMRLVNPNFMEKVEIVPGNLDQPNLGLSEFYQVKLKSVNVILHGAADLRFDEHIKMSYACNVIATRDLLELAKQMPMLKSFVYISTTYAHLKGHMLKEDFYDYEFTISEMSQLLDSLNDSEATAITPLLTQGFVSVYSLSKVITEYLIKDYVGVLPVGILRPSIVLGTNSEPIVAWLNSIQGTTAPIVGSALGFWRVSNTNPFRKIHVIPADKVTNSVIAVAWDISKRDISKPPVYHIVPDRYQVITVESLSRNIKNGFVENDLASEKQLWAYVRINVRNKIICWFLQLFLHLLPGIFFDILLRLKGEKPIVMTLYRKAALLNKYLEQYTSKSYYFPDERIRIIWNKMKDIDKQKFDFNMIDFDWSHYGYSVLKGVKIYLFKESMEDLTKARLRLRRMEMLHFILCTMFKVCIGLIAYKLLLPSFQNYFKFLH